MRAHFPRLSLALLLGSALTARAALAQQPLYPAHHVPTAFGEPWSVALGDLDGDGALDAVAAEALTPGYLSIHPGGGPELLGAPSSIKVGGRPFEVVLADFDGDGALDALTRNDASEDLSALFGDGSGGFGPEQRLDAEGFLGSIAVGDLDGDGFPDAVCAVDLDQGNQALCSFASDGLGAFGAKTCTGAIGLGLRLNLGHADQDGQLDALHTSSSGIALSFGDGQGGFAPQVDFLAPGTAYQFAELLDMDGDGNADIAALGDSGSASIYAFGKGNGAGGFAPFVTTTKSGGSGRAVSGDLDGDGAFDFAQIGADSTIALLFGDGAGGLAGESALLGGFTNEWVALGDLEGDGDVDLVGALRNAQSLVVVSADGPGVFPGPVLSAVGGEAVALADLDGDGALDAVGTHFELGLRALGGDGSGVFVDAGPAGAGPGDISHARLALTDLDGDGVADAIGIANNAHLTRWLGLPGGGFGGGAQFALDSGSNDMALGDLDGDGFLDVAASNFFASPFSTTTSSLATVRGSFTTGFFGLQTLELGDQLTGVELGDLDQDGALDAIATNGYGQQALVLFGDGAGGLSLSGSQQLVVGGTADVQAADADGDGDLDLWVSVGSGFPVPASTRGIDLLLGDGLGQFAAPISFPANLNAGQLELGDVTGDGHLDAVVVDFGLERVRVFVGDGNAGFSLSPFFSAKGELHLADLDADGRLDLLSSDLGALRTHFGQRALPAGVFALGTGTPGCLGFQSLGVTGEPKLGNADFGFTLTGASPQGAGTLFLGSAADLAGSSLFDLLVHIDLAASSFLLGLPIAADGEGGAHLALPLPNQQALFGQGIAAQVLWPWPSHASCDPSLTGSSTSASSFFVILN